MHANQAPRRRHGAELKARVLRECSEPGASVAAVARAHELNANLVHKWRRGRGSAAVPSKPADEGAATTAGFVALALPAVVAASAATAASSPSIHVRIKRGALAISVHWPTSAGAECGAWLRELLR